MSIPATALATQLGSALAAAFLGVLGFVGLPAHAANAVLPEAARAELPQAQALGTKRYRAYGFAVYDAQLWVAPGFRAGHYSDHGFVLSLHYLRAFSGAAIADRSLKEMRHLGPIGQTQAQQWSQVLHQIMPNVQAGDYLLGVNRPGRGLLLIHNGKVHAEWADPEFARRFFGIWLDAHTSAPALRKALLAGSPP